MKQELKIIYNDVIKPAGRFVYDLAAGFFAFPANVRIALEIEKTNYNKGTSRFFGSVAGIFYTILSLPTVLTTYNRDEVNGTTALLLLTPLATNLASGAYEIWRYARNKAKAPASTLIPVSTPISGLETKVEETEINIEKQEIKPQPPKYEIPNPWDIDIEEIEDARYSGLNHDLKRK